MTKTKDIGVKSKPPSKECDDLNCPYHSSLKVRGAGFHGTVVSDKMRKTVTVQWERKKSIPKFERFERRKTSIHAHNPPCIDAKKGDKVRVCETRPLSKTKKFVVVEKFGMDLEAQIKEQTIQDNEVRKETVKEIPVKDAEKPKAEAKENTVTDDKTQIKKEPVK